MIVVWDRNLQIGVNQTLDVATPGLLLDSENRWPGSPPLRVTLLTPLVIVRADGGPDAMSTPGTLELHEDGSFRYTPPREWTGVVSFRIRVTDGQWNGVIDPLITITVVGRVYRDDCGCPANTRRTADIRKGRQGFRSLKNPESHQRWLWKRVRIEELFPQPGAVPDIYDAEITVDRQTGHYTYQVNQDQGRVRALARSGGRYAPTTWTCPGPVVWGADNVATQSCSLEDDSYQWIYSGTYGGMPTYTKITVEMGHPYTDADFEEDLNILIESARLDSIEWDHQKWARFSGEVFVPMWEGGLALIPRLDVQAHWPGDVSAMSGLIPVEVETRTEALPVPGFVFGTIRDSGSVVDLLRTEWKCARGACRSTYYMDGTQLCVSIRQELCATRGYLPPAHDEIPDALDDEEEDMQPLTLTGEVFWKSYQLFCSSDADPEGEIFTPHIDQWYCCREYILPL